MILHIIRRLTVRHFPDDLAAVQVAPSMATTMLDALPYLVDYPYGCTEQTLNRFLPTVVTQRVLQSLKLDLKEIAKHRTNLNSQEIGKDSERLKGWKRYVCALACISVQPINAAFTTSSMRSSITVSTRSWRAMPIR